jgi:3-oxoacyl-[acyl-carrier-protein] synthase II
MKAWPQDVVVTGMGVVSGLGMDLEAHWQQIVNKSSGIQQARQAWIASPLQSSGQAESLELPPDTPAPILKQQRLMSQGAHFGLRAVHEAVNQSGLDLLAIPPERKALYSATGEMNKVGWTDFYPALQETITGNGEAIDRELLNRATIHKVNPFVLLQSLHNNVVAFVSQQYKAQGSNTSLSSHSPCGAQAIELAYRRLLRGDADVAIVVTTCCWTNPVPVYELDTLGLLSRCRDGAQSFRPFDRRRDGFVPGEGAAALLLETSELAQKRNATVLGIVQGTGSFTEVAPTGGFSPPTEACERAVGTALEDAGRSPSDLAFICAHGNATRKGDRAELTALAGALGGARTQVPIYGLKPNTGHMGAAGDIAEIALSLTALRNGLVPATLNFQRVDKEFEGMQVSADHRPATNTCFLSLSQGFGGQSEAIVVSLD